MAVGSEGTMGMQCEVSWKTIALERCGTQTQISHNDKQSRTLFHFVVHHAAAAILAWPCFLLICFVMPHRTVLWATPASISGMRLSLRLYFDIIIASLLLYLASPFLLL